MKNEISELKISNNWRGIYDILAPIEALRLHEVWKDASILSEIGFACGMLAKVSADDIPRRDTDKERFLKQKARYRSEAEMLWGRCLELIPNNARYLSSLAYLHYQNAIELKQPRGRRDGNVRREAEEAIKYYEQALAIAPNRIKDLYRKGYLLAEILPLTYWRDRNFKLAKQKRLDGIQSFKIAIQIWESLDPSNQEQKREQERCRKEYIKSL